MRVPLSLLNLLEKKLRLVASIAGVAFAVVLIFVQFGFMNGIYDTQTKLIESLRADLLIVNKNKVAVGPSRPFSRRRLAQARDVPGVTGAYALYLNEYQSMWKNSVDGRLYPITTIAVRPGDPVFLSPEVQRQAAGLLSGDGVLVDRRARPFYGPLEVGRTAELAGHRVRIAGTFSLGSNFRADGFALTADRTFFKCFAANPSHVEFGVLQIEPGLSPEDVARALLAALPEDVAVYTKAEYMQVIRDYWGDSKAIGKVFGTGAAVGFLIGVMVCYQILFAGITERLPQYATLRAMGYGNVFLLKVVLQEATLLGLAGFLLGWSLSLLAYEAIEVASGVLMDLTLARAAPILLLTVAMCWLSGVIAAGRAMRLDPAEVFA